jgi:hypothetical protein
MHTGRTLARAQTSTTHLHRCARQLVARLGLEHQQRGHHINMDPIVLPMYPAVVLVLGEPEGRVRQRDAAKFFAKLEQHPVELTLHRFQRGRRVRRQQRHFQHNVGLAQGHFTWSFSLLHGGGEAGGRRGA